MVVIVVVVVVLLLIIIIIFWFGTNFTTSLNGSCGRSGVQILAGAKH